MTALLASTSCGGLRFARSSNYLSLCGRGGRGLRADCVAHNVRLVEKLGVTAMIPTSDPFHSRANSG